MNQKKKSRNRNSPEAVLKRAGELLKSGVVKWCKGVAYLETFPGEAVCTLGAIGMAVCPNQVREGNLNWFFDDRTRRTSQKRNKSYEAAVKLASKRAGITALSVLGYKDSPKYTGAIVKFNDAVAKSVEEVCEKVLY